MVDWVIQHPDPSPQDAGAAMVVARPALLRAANREIQTSGKSLGVWRRAQELMISKGAALAS
jgi:hypothetical protein